MLFVITTGVRLISGRFYAVPFFVAIILFVRNLDSKQVALSFCALLVAYIAWSPISAIKYGTSAYKPYTQNPSYIDTKWFVYNEGAALINWRPGKEMPAHKWYQWGESLQGQDETVFVGGAFGGPGIGYVGFAAGPEKHFVDEVALSDPLLARLPPSFDVAAEWQSGHFYRSVPAGYAESIRSGENLIEEPDTKAYYDFVRIITQDPIFSWERFRVILNMNLGQYDYLIADVEESQNE